MIRVMHLISTLDQGDAEAMLAIAYNRYRGWL